MGMGGIIKYMYDKIELLRKVKCNLGIYIQSGPLHSVIFFATWHSEVFSSCWHSSNIY